MNRQLKNCTIILNERVPHKKNTGRVLICIKSALVRNVTSTARQDDNDYENACESGFFE